MSGDRAERAATNGRVWRLTPVELGALLLLLNASLWGAAAVNIATPGLKARSGLIKGADFVHFYTLGSIVAERRGDLLYDVEAQHVEQGRLVPASRDDLFVPVYGPQTALLFVPLARLPYLWAASVWAALTALLYFACLRAIWRDCPHLRSHKIVFCLAATAFPPFWYLVLYGQTSALPLLCVTCGWLALRADRKWWAGVALGSLIIKPQLGVAVAVTMLARREWRVVGGALAAVGLQWGAAIAAVGIAPFSGYLRTLVQGPRLARLLEPLLFQLHSLRGFWTLAIPQPTAALVLYLLTSMAVLALAVLLWRPSVPLEIRYSALLLATVLVAPHLTVYELVVVAPAFLLTAERVEWATPASRRVVRVLLCLVYILPLGGWLARVTHVQLSVLALTGWLVMLYLERSRYLRLQGVDADCTSGQVVQDLSPVSPTRPAGCRFSDGWDPTFSKSFPPRRSLA